MPPKEKNTQKPRRNTGQKSGKSSHTQKHSYRFDQSNKGSVHRSKPQGHYKRPGGQSRHSDNKPRRSGKRPGYIVKQQRHSSERPANKGGQFSRVVQLPKTGNALNKNVLRIIPLGGFEEVGRNMMILEYKDDIIIIDMGLQFPEDETPGIDYIIPNITYLKDKVRKIRGVIITHGHYDHIGAIPHLMEQLGNPTIYATPLTTAVIKKRQLDFPNTPKLVMEHINENTATKLGVFNIRYFPVTHNIPEGVGMEIETPVGIIVHPGEFKFDYDRNYKPVDIDVFKELGKKNVKLLMLDSTNVEVPGRSVPEWKAEEGIEKLLSEAEGRVIISTFASLLNRLAQIINIGSKLGRKIAITGRSMETNFAIAQELGLIKIKKGTVIPIKEIDKYHDKKILILSTGAQGERFAGLTRIAAGTHRDVKIRRGDSIIFSSSIVPGNEMAVQVLRDGLARQGAIVYHYKILDIHSGGHAKREELRDAIEMVKPEFFMPIHGFFYMRSVNAKLAQETGVKTENIVVGDNGQIVEITRDNIRLLKETTPTNYVMVDGLGVGDIGTVVIRDRQHLAEDGMFVIISVINSKTGKVIGNPDIISRGFVYLRESKELLRETRKHVKSIIEHATAGKHPINEANVKNDIRKKIGKFLFTKTERSPMILPVIIEV